MAKYPVERTDSDGIAEALNYVLSGPAGLGQNFSGVSVSETGYLTGNFRVPFTSTAPVVVYVEPIPLGTSERLDPNTWKFTFETFASTGSSIAGFVLTIGTLTSGTVGVGQYVTGSGVAAGTKIVSNISGSGSGSTWRVSISQTVSSTAIGGNYTDGVAPFPLGSRIEVNGVTPSLYDGTYSPIGVAECTSTYVIARTNTPYPDPGTGSGGTVGLSLFGGYNSTDGDARVTVNSASDRVFISAQVLNTITYKASLTSQMFYNVAVNRYVGFPSNDPANPDFIFDAPVAVAYRTYNFATLDPTENSVPSDTALAYSGNKAASAVTYPIVYTVNPTTVTGSGSNLSLEITQFPTGATIYSISNTSIKVVSGGEGYDVGDTLVVPGNLLGGATPGNDMNLTVSGVTSGTVTLEPIDTLFTSIIDTPPPGYYRYILEVEFVPSPGSDAVITQCELGYRSLSCQVVKE